MQLVHKRALFFAFLCGLVLACTMASLIFFVGFREVAWFAKAGTIQYIVGWLVALLVLVVGTIAGYAVLVGVPKLGIRIKELNPWPWMPLSFDRTSVVKATMFILVFWLPFVVLQYPCAMNGDTYNQLYQFQTSYPTIYTAMGITVDASFVDHHPVFDTLLFGMFLSLGDVLGSQNVGLFIYSVLQSLLGAIFLAIACCYLQRLGVPKVFRLVSLLFCAFFFLFPLWTSTMIKDSLHSVFFILYFVCFIEVFRTRGKVLGNTGFVFIFVLAALLAALAKKPGLYIVVVSLGALVLYCSRGFYIKRLLAVFFVVPVVQVLLFPLVVYPAIGGVEPGGRQESFGFALQQVVTVIRSEDDLSNNEREAVEAVLDIQRAVEKYSPSIVDPVKNSAKKEATRSDYARFIAAYFSIGVRHIPAYTYSVGSTVSALICPGAELSYNRTPEQEEGWVERFEKADSKGELSLTFYKPTTIDNASLAFSEFYRNHMSNPLFKILLSKGLFGGWVPLICIVLSWYGGRKYLVAYSPIILSFIFAVLSPVTSTRYIIPLMFTTILSLGLLYFALTHQKKEIDET